VINAEFGEEVQVVPIMDPGATGNFEVVIKEADRLIHSKSTNGQGRCESSGEVGFFPGALTPSGRGSCLALLSPVSRQVTSFDFLSCTPCAALAAAPDPGCN